MHQPETSSSTVTLAELVESDFLHCGSCHEMYQHPVLLPCLHSFCLACITKLSTDTKKNGILQFECPTCKSNLSVPSSILNQPNLFLLNMCELNKLKHHCTRLCEYCKYDNKKITATTRCLECHDDMCDPCSRAHHRTRVTRNHKLAPYEQITKGLYDHDIRDHQEEKCLLHKEENLCMFCETCDLLLCKDCNAQHYGDHKVFPAEDVFKNHKDQLESFHKGLQKRIPAIQEYISFVLSHETNMKNMKEELLSLIQEQADILHKLIDDYKNSLMEQLNQTSKEESMKVMDKCGDLKVAEVSLKQNEHFLSNILQFGRPVEVLHVHKLISERLQQLIHMKPDGLTHKLFAHFQNGSATEQNIKIMFGDLSISNIPLDQEDAPVQRLSIANVMPDVQIPELVTSFDAKLNSDQVDVWPTGLCSTSDGYVIVDRDNKKLKVFSEEGKLKRQFSGKGDHALGCPFDAAVLKSGHIAVTDYKNEDVKVYTLTGECTLTISGHFRHPRGITTNDEGHIVVVDCHLLQIMTFDPSNGNLLSCIKVKDTNASQLLTDPYYITVTDVGDLVVSDHAAPNIKVISTNGELLAQYGTYGTIQDRVLKPYGICVDRHGYILVADHQNSRIHLLLPDGRFSQFLLDKSDKLWHPVSLTVNSKGHLVIAEALGMVKVYKYI